MTLSVGRPRTAGRLDLPDNLQPRPRAGVVYWYWRDPRDGIEKPLKCPNDRETAIRRAKELNALVAMQQVDDLITTLAASPKKTLGTPFNAFAVRYLNQLEGMAANTIKTRRCQVNAAIKFFGARPMHEIDVPDFVALFKTYTSQGKHRMAQSMRSTLIDVWDEAYSQGVLPADKPNPASVSKRPKAKVKSARLIIDHFPVILEQSRKLAVTRGAWIPNSQLLGLVTGQRREDLVLAQFKRGRDWLGLWHDYQIDKQGAHPYAHVHEGYFWVVQQKTGALVKIPLSLKLDVIGLTVGQVIDMCRSKVASRYLLHHTIPFGNAPLGSPVHKDKVSHAFQDARDLTDLEWPGKKPPPYRELRSLSEREYKKQGIDAQSLLGHKHARMTEVYDDPRQAEWKTV
jgi:enterobacteria phage integrase